MKTSEKAYSAGIFDGEGNISSNGTGGINLVITCKKQNGELMPWLEEVWGGKTYPIGNGVFQWKATGSILQTRFLLKTLPFLRLKKNQARLALSLLFLIRKLSPVFHSRQQPDEVLLHRQILLNVIKECNADTPPTETERERLIGITKQLLGRYLSVCDSPPLREAEPEECGACR